MKKKPYGGAQAFSKQTAMTPGQQRYSAAGGAQAFAAHAAGARRPNTGGQRPNQMGGVPPRQQPGGYGGRRAQYGGQPSYGQRPNMQYGRAGWQPQAQNPRQSPYSFGQQGGNQGGYGGLPDGMPHRRGCG